ncbi:FGGY-family carbohydrate kinase [Nonomuraea sp. NPDC046570]|uniref:FGGY-family carbohydrate kinase n=1 Tax=Nonomuraea sp. NPDC046570 TaxID=3155255 RepID=UPI0033C636BB
MAAICVDAGTTLIKAVGYDASGAEVALARREAGVIRRAAATAEQDMTAVWDAVAQSVREVAAALDEPADFVALTAQGDGAWLVDETGRPAGPAILWNDGRAAGIVEEWARDGVVERAFRRNGSLTSSGLQHAVLAWLRRHEPRRLERSSAVLTCAGWIFSRMTGELAADESPFMDARTRAHTPDLLDEYGMRWAERLLPALRADTDRAADLTGEAAAELGLPPGTPVVLAPYDIAATALGVGAVQPGQASSILGTTLCTQTVVDAPGLTGEPAGINVGLGVPGRYLRAFPTFSGGEVVGWAARLLGLGGPAELADLADGAAPGAGGLAFLPYLSPAGERAPFHDPLARGALLGLSFEHGRAEVARAVLEGLSLVIQDCLVAAGGRPRELRVCGGGAASAPWLRLIADVTGLPVIRSADAEVGARGAYLTGLVATGAAPDVDEAARRHVRLGPAREPDPGRRALYSQMYEDFLTVREMNTPTWPVLTRTRGRS